MGKTSTEVTRLKQLMKNAERAEKFAANVKRASTPESILKFRKDNSPNGDRCTKSGCDGKVTRKVRRIVHFQIETELPQCEKCGEIYLFGGDDIEIVGVAEYWKRQEEFEKRLRTTVYY